MKILDSERLSLIKDAKKKPFDKEKAVQQWKKDNNIPLDDHETQPF